MSRTDEEKALKKQTKIKITQRVKEELEQPKVEEEEEEEEEVKPQPKLVRQKTSVVEPQPVYHPQHQPAPVNNYYYYGAPPLGPQHHYESEGGWLPQKTKPRRKNGKKARPPTPSSSEEEQSDVDEPESYKDLHSNIVEPEPQPKIPRFKFSYA